MKNTTIEERYTIITAIYCNTVMEGGGDSTLFEVSDIMGAPDLQPEKIQACMGDLESGELNVQKFACGKQSAKWEDFPSLLLPSDLASFRVIHPFNETLLDWFDQSKINGRTVYAENHETMFTRDFRAVYSTNKPIADSSIEGLVGEIEGEHEWEIGDLRFDRFSHFDCLFMDFFGHFFRCTAGFYARLKSRCSSLKELGDAIYHERINSKQGRMFKKYFPLERCRTMAGILALQSFDSVWFHLFKLRRPQQARGESRIDIWADCEVPEETTLPNTFPIGELKWNNFNEYCANSSLTS